LGQLFGASFKDSTLQSCTFSTDLIIKDMDMSGVRGLETCLHLDRVRLEGDYATLEHSLVNTLRLSPIEKFASWERLRTFGRPPLFGVSFSALVAIPTVTFLLGVYNEQVDRLHQEVGSLQEKVPRLRQYVDLLPESVAAHSEELLAFVTSLVLRIVSIADSVHRIPIPNLTFWLLISTVLLGTASMLYALVCPPRIKEFSLERWTDELNRPALHYLPLSWSHRWVRVVAGVCYLLGGAGTLSILIMKLWNTGEFIIKNTELDLPWWQW
jgi:hypothetical protein